jgi:hypothetical protein
MDVVINPLDEKDEFVSCKAELKYIECGAANVPIVTARTHPFTEVIREGENGFFASTPEEYAKKALMVCRDGNLARAVANAANDDVRSRYNSTTNARQFIANLMDAMEVKPEVVRREFYVEPFSLLQTKLGAVDKSVVGPLAYGQMFEFAIPLMPDCELQGMSVLGATYCKMAQLGVNYQIWINGKKHRDGVIPPSLMKDNEWWSVEFQVLLLKRGDTMTLRLSNRDDLINIGFYECTNKMIGRAKMAGKPVHPIAIKLRDKKEGA